EETLLLMAESGAPVQGELGSLLARRLDLLPPASLRLLTAGAILGPSFPVSLAASLAGVPENALEEARRRHLVSEDGHFTHARVRLPGRIAELAFRRGDHAAAARALEGALALLGQSPPRFPLPAVAWQILRRVFPVSARTSEADRLAAFLHSRLTWPWYFQR